MKTLKLLRDVPRDGSEAQEAYGTAFQFTYFHPDVCLRSLFYQRDFLRGQYRCDQQGLFRYAHWQRARD